MKNVSRILISGAEICSLALIMLILVGFNESYIECTAQATMLVILLVVISLLLRTIHTDMIYGKDKSK